MKIRRKRTSRQAVNRVMASFARLNGEVDHRYDRRAVSAGGETRALRVEQNKSLFRKCVETDFDYLLSLKFAAPRQSLQDLLPQSVLGRALNGHGWFVDDDGVALRFVDASFDRICTILEAQDGQLTNLKIRARRNQQIDRLRQLVLTNIARPSFDLVDAAGPLFDIDFLRGQRVETAHFLRGMLLAGWMDNHAWRDQTLNQKPLTFSKTPLELGGGDIFVINRQRFAQIGLGDTGARVFTAEDITSLKNLGVIEATQQEYNYPQQDQAYFRRSDGLGVSDDLALLYIGKRYGFDALLGAFLMDAVDSYDKFLLNFFPGGMDAQLAGHISRAWQKQSATPLVSDAEICGLIHFAAKQNTPSTRLSSSHRRLIQFEEKCEQPTLLQHWRFLEGKPLNKIKLGFARVPAEEFYQTAMERFYASGIYVQTPVFQ